MQLVKNLVVLDGLYQFTITINGVLKAPFFPELKKLGINSINLSLNTLNRDRFVDIAYYDELPKILKGTVIFSMLKLIRLNSDE